LESAFETCAEEAKASEEESSFLFFFSLDIVF